MTDLTPAPGGSSIAGSADQRVDMPALAMGLLFSAIWSSAFATGKLIVADAPPLLSLSLRFLLAGCLGVAIGWALGQKIDFERRQWIAIIVLGLCQNTLYLGFCFLAFQRIDASLVVILASLLPLLVAVANRVFLGQRLGWIATVGLIAGVVGVAMVMLDRLSGGADVVGIALTLIGVGALAAATLLVGNAFAGNRQLLMIVGLQMLVGSVSVFCASAAFEVWQVNWTPRLLIAFSWITIAPGLFATVLWFALVGRIGSTRAATFHFLNPFFGVAVAAMLLGEQLSWRDAAGVAVIMLAILLVQTGTRRR